jgi:hypothetical protein
MTWPAALKWPGGISVPLSAAINAVDMLIMTYRLDTTFWYTTLQKAFA